LGYLASKRIVAWTNDELEKMIEVFSREVVKFPLPGLPFDDKILTVLKTGVSCRRCGKCCRGSQTGPDHPGFVVLDEDLRAMAQHTKYSVKYLRGKARYNKNPDYPEGKYLPLPCMFFEKRENGCGIYEFRPCVCRSYPAVHTAQGDVAIDVQCDYGKDMCRRGVELIKRLAFNRAMIN
jgi:Fe-S-cluster containining protein